MRIAPALLMEFGPFALASTIPGAGEAKVLLTGCGELGMTSILNGLGLGVAQATHWEAKILRLELSARYTRLPL